MLFSNQFLQEVEGNYTEKLLKGFYAGQTMYIKVNPFPPVHGSTSITLAEYKNDTTGVFSGYQLYFKIKNAGHNKVKQKLEIEKLLKNAFSLINSTSKPNKYLETTFVCTKTPD